MADKIVLADTSILIDLFRKTDKTNPALISLVRQGYSYCISAITEYEIYTGTTSEQAFALVGLLLPTESPRLVSDKRAAEARC